MTTQTSSYKLSRQNLTRRGLGIATIALVMLLIMTPLSSTNVLASSSNGSAGQMPAYYDDKLFTINFMELPTNGEKSTLTQNNSINTIYMCDQCESSGFMFISVLDAIQGDGFNPLWQEVQIVFTPGNTPHQLTSDTAIAAAAASGEITLNPTDEVYRCSVVGPGPK